MTNNPQTALFSGLNQREVQERIARLQINYVKKFTTRTTAGILRNNMLTLFNGVLIIAVIALMLVHANTDALFLSTVTAINMLVGLVEEFRAKLTLDRLTLLHQRTVRVIRSCAEQIIPIESIVKDDVVAIVPGEQFIADGFLISSRPIYVDESLVTGEAETIKKEVNDSLLSGTICIAGEGYYKATKVGKNSQINEITAHAKNYKRTSTPLQNDIDRIIEVLTVTMVAFVILLSVVAVMQKLSLTHSVLAIVTVIKSLVPQGLVLIVTLAFTLGAIRAAKKKVLVQKINAIESMGHLTTLCLDKTGTIGTNKLRFQSLEVLSGLPEEIATKIKLFTGTINDKNKTIQAIEEKFMGIKSELIAELPFTSAHKTSAVQIHYENTNHSLWLGAPENLAKEQLNIEEIKILNNLRGQGLRVLLFAESSQPIDATSRLIHLAFIVLRDELRPNVKETIDFYEKRGVVLKILSGDHPETIAALANQAGITKTGGLINGQNLIGLSEQEFNTIIKKGQFFGSLTPQQKQQIIKALQSAKEFIGMVGDGVNDVLALKQADIGIAMNSGAAAAKDVADITLLENNFTHLPFLSQEGDRIIYNIKRIAKLFITKNVYCLLYIIFAMLLRLEFPLSPRYITWIDMLTIGIPITILTLTVPKLPKQSAQKFFMETIKFALIAGTIIAAFAALIYAYCSLWKHQVALYGKTASISVIIIMGLYIVFFITIPANKKTETRQQRRLIWETIILSGLLFLCGMHWQLVRKILDVAFLDMFAWKTIAIAGMAGILALKLALKQALFSTKAQKIAQ